MHLFISLLCTYLLELFRYLRVYEDEGILEDLVENS